MNEDNEKTRLLAALSRHIGQERAIPMDELFIQVFERPVGNKINDTRKLRKLVTRLRLEGVPIASVSNWDGGGYYLAAVGSEMEEYLKRLHKRALRALHLESTIRGVSLPVLLGQMQLRLAGQAGAGS